MITAYFIHVNNLPDEYVFNKLLGKLDDGTRKKILIYKSRKEQWMRICGKHLLYKLLRDCNTDQRISFNDIKYNTWGKPYFNDDFDFSIAHSGNMVVCAGIKGGKIGVDIEIKEDRNTENLREYFTDAEWGKISADNSNATFYKLWVRKEACLKAIGKGLFQPLNEIDVIGREVTSGCSKWYLHDIQLKDGYAACIATDMQNTGVNIAEVSINNLINEY